MVGTSNLGSWNSHLCNIWVIYRWFLRGMHTKKISYQPTFQIKSEICWWNTFDFCKKTSNIPIFASYIHLVAGWTPTLPAQRTHRTHWCLVKSETNYEFPQDPSSCWVEVTTRNVAHGIDPGCSRGPHKSSSWSGQSKNILWLSMEVKKWEIHGNSSFYPFYQQQKETCLVMFSLPSGKQTLLLKMARSK